MTYKIHLFWTMFASSTSGFLLLIAQRIRPRMYWGKLGDLWIYYYIYLFVMIIDFVLTYRTSDFRVYTSIVFISVQVAYVYREWLLLKGTTK